MLADRFRNKAVWLSGHTGFKGAWLAHWLVELGAKVHGFAQEAPTTPSLYAQLGLEDRLQHRLGDVCDAEAVRKSLHDAKPDFVFHLAAQPLVRRSYEVPVETFATNVLGTVHVLEALRSLAHPCAAVLVTTDKCYENREWVHGYRENDPLGGHDPYSASKAAAEIAIQAWRQSFSTTNAGRTASARAGNVIGGGDWAADRIVPDCVRALQQDRSILVRNKTATRPWQHVLEPLGGYLWLAAVLATPELAPGAPQALASAFNFGPRPESSRTVGELVTEILKHWPGAWKDGSDPAAPHEAHRLQLAVDKANAVLGWRPVWDFETAIEATVRWYRAAVQAGPTAGTQELRRLTTEQIHGYQADAARAGLRWAQD